MRGLILQFAIKLMANQFNQKSLENQFANSAKMAEIGFPWRIFIFSGFLFSFSIFVFLGLKLGYGTYLAGRSKFVDKNIEQLAKQVSASEQANLTTFYSQLVNLENVLNGHKFSSNTFSFLEKNTVQNVYYTVVDFDLKTQTLRLSGRGRSLNEIVAQLGAFDKAPEAKTVSLDNVGFEGVEVIFSASVVFKEGYFDKIE